MNIESIVFELGVIVVGAAILGTLFLYTRQPIIIAYIAIGIIAGPSGFALIQNTGHIEQIARLGVILLLFLIGLNLQPAKLLRLFRKVSLLTFATSLLFGVLAFLFAIVFGFPIKGALPFGAAMMFSSTVVGLKLIPTTTLHHRRTGEVMTSVLLLQDIMAILVILFITGDKSDHHVAITFALLATKFVLLCVASFVGVRFVMIPLLTRFDVVQEYTFVATLAWCLLWAEIAHKIGLSYEMGAFIAGLSIASCQVAIVIAEHLKPLREFFLILFFYAVGARIDLRLAPHLLIAAMAFGALLVPFKAFVFKIAFEKSGEAPTPSRELAVRMSQASEFSLLIAFSAFAMKDITNEQAMMIQAATIVTFIVSTYWVVLRYPTPITKSRKLNRD